MHISVLSALLAASCVSSLAIEKRQNNNFPDGFAEIGFGCEQLIIPDLGPPQNGGGGEGVFNAGNVQMRNPDGSIVDATDCENAQSGCLGTCFRNCRVESPFLYGPITELNTNFIPAGGRCTMVFNYMGKRWSTITGEPDGSCATTNDGFQPFSSSQSAKCFIEANPNP